jgi:hypothetical protein
MSLNSNGIGETNTNQKMGRDSSMENNENLVTENVAENVEQTTEQTPQVKTYTQEEVDAIVSRRNARTRAKIEKEYERRYGSLVDTLKAGTGKESVDEINDTFKEFYTNKGITIPERPKYSDRDVETLAKADAEEIIRSGFEEVVEEVDRLAEIGAANMTAREKAIFRVLAEHRQNTETSRELEKIGVTEDVYNSAEFQDFKKMFTKDTPIAKIYETYAKTQPTKKHQTDGKHEKHHGKG